MTFTLPIEQQDTQEGAPVSFLCKLSKPSLVTWYKDDHEIRPGDAGFVMTSQGDECKLTLTSPTLADAGQYTVKCGEMESSAKLVVHGKEQCSLDREVLQIVKGQFRLEEVEATYTDGLRLVSFVIFRFSLPRLVPRFMHRKADILTGKFAHNVDNL